VINYNKRELISVFLHVASVVYLLKSQLYFLTEPLVNLLYHTISRSG